MAGAVALAALALVSTRWIAAPQATPPVLQANASHAIEEMWDRIQPSTDAILDAAPLQNEVDAVYSDARSAIGFLALNFLPSTSESIQKAGIIP